MKDLIDRQAAIDEVERWLLDRDDNRTVKEMLMDLPSSEPEKVCIANITLLEEQVREAAEKAKSEIVQVLSSAQPRMRGKWKTGINENGVTTSLFCSECNYENKHWYEWNYCPNCGCDMRGEESDATD